MAGNAEGWVGPLVATLAIQAAAAFLTRIVPTVAPALTAELGLSGTAVGYLAAAGTLGSILFLLAGAPLIRRAGPIRALQLGLVAGAAGTALLAAPLVAAAVAASVLIGLGYGPTAPAGSDVLQRRAPARHRNLVFSVKQAGVPIGGALAGLLLPPAAEALGWRAALAIGAAAAILTALAVEPLRGAIDADREPSTPLTPRILLAPANLVRPLAAVWTRPGLRRAALAGAAFAFGQGCLFAFLVTFAVERLALGLTAAGGLFAVTQATGIVGRLALGYASDRLGSGLAVLRLVALTSAATSAVFALAGPGWPPAALVLLAGVAGITVSSWNGVQIAEIARLSPRDGVAETTAGATVLIFVGYVAGPAVFALLVEASGRYDVAFAAVAAVTLAALPALAGVRPGGGA